VHRAPQAQHERNLAPVLLKGSAVSGSYDEAGLAVALGDEARAREVSAKVFDHRLDRNDSHRAADDFFIGGLAGRVDCLSE
jgi:hypothetical protein